MHNIRETNLSAYAAHLRRAEKSAATAEKYLRYARAFTAFAGAEPTRDAAVAWKQHITARYTAAGANGMIAAVNSFFQFLGRGDLRLAPLRVQRRTLVPPGRELNRADFDRLTAAARRQGQTRLLLMMQCMTATGIRVSELPFITVEAARDGQTQIRLKGKTREIFLSAKLRPLLLQYAARQGISGGAIFVTRTGRPLDRHAVWRGMKSLCRAAGVPPTKVFPHNLRRLFARTFYAKIPNLTALADLMGHSDVNTTRIYTATTGAELRRQLDSLRLIL